MAYVHLLSRATGVVHGRVDDGVDFCMNIGSPIVAIGNGHCIQIKYGWYAGQPIMVFTLDDGPYAGRKWYVAEQITPDVRIGQYVLAGQQVCTFAPTGTCIETGWASPTQDGYISWPTLAQHNGHGGQVPAPEGTAYDSFLQTLGSGGQVTTGAIPITGAPTPTPPAGVDFSPVQDDIQASSMYERIGPGSVNAAQRAHQGYLDAQSTWNEYSQLSVFTTKGGH